MWPPGPCSTVFVTNGVALVPSAEPRRGRRTIMGRSVDVRTWSNPSQHSERISSALDSPISGKMPSKRAVAGSVGVQTRLRDGVSDRSSDATAVHRCARHLQRLSNNTVPTTRRWLAWRVTEPRATYQPGVCPRVRNRRGRPCLVKQYVVDPAQTRLVRASGRCLDVARTSCASVPPPAPSQSKQQLRDGLAARELRKLWTVVQAAVLLDSSMVRR